LTAKRRRRSKPRSQRSSVWAWILGLACVLGAVGVGALVWSRSGTGQAALLNLGAEKLYGEVQTRLGATLATALPAITDAATGDDAHDWPLPEAGPVAMIHCRVVPIADDHTWWQVQDRLNNALRQAGGQVLWSERIPRSRGKDPDDQRDLLRLDLGVPGRPTHTLVLYREDTRRPEVRWGGDPLSGAWRTLHAQTGVPVVALVFDDWGYKLNDTTRGFLALDVPLTLSIIPDLPYSRKYSLEATDLALPGSEEDLAPVESSLADEAARLRIAAGCPVTLGVGKDVPRLASKRREVMLHLPMQPQGYPEVNPGDDAIMVGMDRRRMASILDEALSSLPHIRGVNNHMGSAATADQATMDNLMVELKGRNLFFLDSLTTARSVAYESALSAGLPAARNKVFLDHDHQDTDRIRRQLRKLADRARSSGFAVGIGHPHSTTLAVLRQELPRLQSQGVLFVTMSELLALQTRQN